jgi:hypothetical protein
MSACNTKECIAVQALVEKWLKDGRHDDVPFSVFEAQNSGEVFVRVMIPENLRQTSFEPGMRGDDLDPSSQQKIKQWLAKLPYPKHKPTSSASAAKR